MWQDFLARFPTDHKLPWFPIWSAEFGATYPYEETTPYMLGVDGVRPYLGSHGRTLSTVAEE